MNTDILNTDILNTDILKSIAQDAQGVALAEARCAYRGSLVVHDELPSDVKELVARQVAEMVDCTGHSRGFVTALRNRSEELTRAER